MVISVPAVPAPKVRVLPKSLVIGPPSADVPSCVCPSVALKASTSCVNSALTGADFTTALAVMSDVLCLVYP